MATVFIDGQAGTTGLEITERLAARPDLELVYLGDSERKDPARRADCIAHADVSILCLPDDAARESVALAVGAGRIIDASTAHRVDPDWTYGLPELDQEQRTRIHETSRLSNPGCYPQGFILSVRPLVTNGWLASAEELSVNALSGYSGGGRKMIEAHRAFDEDTRDRLNVQAYGLDLAHKHVPEMSVHAKLSSVPLFTPTVAHYYRGMLVSLPLFSSQIGGRGAADVHALLADTYAGEPFIDVLPLDLSMTQGGYLNATDCNGTNRLELMVFGSETQVVIYARYDNLGKGAAGAAIQNLNLMLGADETEGL